MRHWSEAATQIVSKESRIANKGKGGGHSKKAAEGSLKEKRAANKAKRPQNFHQSLDKAFGH